MAHKKMKACICIYAYSDLDLCWSLDFILNQSLWKCTCIERKAWAWPTLRWKHYSRSLLPQRNKRKRKESCFISLGVWEKSLALFETLNEILDFGIEAEREMDPRAGHPLWPHELVTTSLSQPQPKGRVQSMWLWKHNLIYITMPCHASVFVITLSLVENGLCFFWN